MHHNDPTDLSPDDRSRAAALLRSHKARLQEIRERFSMAKNAHERVEWFHENTKMQRCLEDAAAWLEGSLNGSE